MLSHSKSTISFHHLFYLVLWLIGKKLEEDHKKWDYLLCKPLESGQLPVILNHHLTFAVKRNDVRLSSYNMPAVTTSWKQSWKRFMISFGGEEPP